MAESGLIYKLYPAAKRGKDESELIKPELLWDETEIKLSAELQEFIKNLIP